MRTEMNCGIYRITHAASGKFYIGSSANLRRRLQAHRGHLRRGTHHAPHLQHAWAKHGEDAFAFETLLVCAPDMLLFYEQALIDGLRPVYNTASVAGTLLGVKLTAKVKATMSTAQRGWRKKYDYQGERLCLADIAERAGVPHTRLISRVVGMGMTLERAIEQPARASSRGPSKAISLREFCRTIGVSDATIKYRLQRGTPLLDAFPEVHQ